jgi:hypothetical protein
VPPADNEQHFIKYVLAFFAGSDGIVLENLAVRFMQGEGGSSSSSGNSRLQPLIAASTCRHPDKCTRLAC